MTERVFAWSAMAAGVFVLPYQVGAIVIAASVAFLVYWSREESGREP